MDRDPNRSRDGGGPQPIGRIVSRLMARQGYDRERAAEAVAAAWRAAVPAAVAERSWPGRIRRGVLEVFVSHSAVVQEFTFHKRDVLARLRASLPATPITDIRCRLAAPPGP